MKLANQLGLQHPSSSQSCRESARNTGNSCIQDSSKHGEIVFDEKACLRK